jgi:hypothetical protein
LYVAGPQRERFLKLFSGFGALARLIELQADIDACFVNAAVLLE